jgi:hypothetical protein
MLKWGPIAAVLGMAAALLVSGCSETELVVNSSKVLAQTQQPAAAAYKIGQPYQVAGVWYYPKVDYGYDETGIASCMGRTFTASRRRAARSMIRTASPRLTRHCRCPPSCRSPISKTGVR